jgi:YegS/Rv2252/BmrU family lipid kinase
MDKKIDVNEQNVFAVINPIAGHSDAEEIQGAVKDLCARRRWTFEMHETSSEDDLAEITRTAIKDGATMVLVAGGDGTVGAVINGVVHSNVPLGIIPVGTGNGLARALKIPLQINDVMTLFDGEYDIHDIDTMQVGDFFAVLNVSAGISARAMQQTEPEDKRRLGILAYAQTIIKDLTATKPFLYKLNLDGMEIRVRATEVLVSNGKLLKEPPFLFGTPETLDDGRLEVNILTAEKPTEYARLAWDLLLDPNQSAKDLHDLAVHQSIELNVVDTPQLVQADGEIIGETPTEVRLVPKSLKVIIPFSEHEKGER